MMCLPLHCYVPDMQKYKFHSLGSQTDTELTGIWLPLRSHTIQHQYEWYMLTRLHGTGSEIKALWFEHILYTKGRFLFQVFLKAVWLTKSLERGYKLVITAWERHCNMFQQLSLIDDWWLIMVPCRWGIWKTWYHVVGGWGDHGTVTEGCDDHGTLSVRDVVIMVLCHWGMRWSWHPVTEGCGDHGTLSVRDVMITITCIATTGAHMITSRHQTIKIGVGTSQGISKHV